jgi:hypothetical protein
MKVDEKGGGSDDAIPDLTNDLHYLLRYIEHTTRSYAKLFYPIKLYYMYLNKYS